MVGRCRIKLFFRAALVHQISVMQRTLKLYLLSLRISKKSSNLFGKLLIFPWIVLIIALFFCLGKQIFNTFDLPKILVPCVYLVPSYVAFNLKILQLWSFFFPLPFFQSEFSLNNYFFSLQSHVLLQQNFNLCLTFFSCFAYFYNFCLMLINCKLFFCNLLLHPHFLLH